MASKGILIQCLSLLNLPDEELMKLAAVLNTAIEQRIEELNAAAESAVQQLEVFEAKYHMGYDRFRSEYLNRRAEYPAEDYITWGFWQRVKTNRVATLTQYRALSTGHKSC